MSETKKERISKMRIKFLVIVFSLLCVGMTMAETQPAVDASKIATKQVFSSMGTITGTVSWDPLQPVGTPLLPKHSVSITYDPARSLGWVSVDCVLMSDPIYATATFMNDGFKVGELHDVTNDPDSWVITSKFSKATLVSMTVKLIKQTDEMQKWHITCHIKMLNTKEVIVDMNASNLIDGEHSFGFFDTSNNSIW